MRCKTKLFLAGLVLATPIPALADDSPCFDQPGRNTPPCVLASGEAALETALAGFERDSDAASTTDTTTLLDSVLRYGVGGDSEVQIGIGGYGFQRVQDRATGTVMRAEGIGDAYLGLRHNFSGANGPVAIQVFATLPTGRTPIGAGDWGAGVLLPMSFDLPGKFALALTPEVDAAVNASGSGRHLAYGSAVGLSHPLGPAVTLGAEWVGFQDEDPSGHNWQSLATVEAAWQIGKRWQVDAECDFGLSNAAPRHVLTIGIARML